MQATRTEPRETASSDAAEVESLREATSGRLGVEASGVDRVAEAAPSFDDVYREHFDLLWRSARSMGIPPAAVDDVLQDVFLVVHRRLPEFEGRASMRTWLARILVRVVSAHRRRFRRKEDHVALEREVVDRGHGPMEATARAEAVALLTEILEAMDENQRVVFVLAEIEGFTMPEIAETVEVGVNTAYSRLRLARQTYTRELARLRLRDGGTEP